MRRPPKLPLNHLTILSLSTHTFEYSAYVLIIYWISILYVLFTLRIAVKFPDTFGSKYLDFLKRHSSPGVFERHCGSSWSALKAAIKDLKFIKMAAQHEATTKKC